MDKKNQNLNDENKKGGNNVNVIKLFTASHEK